MPRAFALLSLLALAACDGSSPFTNRAPDVDTVPVSAGDVAEARARWDVSGGSTYTMTLQRSCFCGQEALGPFDVGVESGAVVSVRRGGKTLELSRGRSIEDLFLLLDDALAEDAASVRAAFDTASGYPIALSIDYNEFVADEEIGYTVWNVARR